MPFSGSCNACDWLPAVGILCGCGGTVWNLRIWRGLMKFMQIGVVGPETRRKKDRLVACPALLLPGAGYSASGGAARPNCSRQSLGVSLNLLRR